MKTYQDELKECLEKVDVNQFSKFIFKHHRENYFSWLCLSYKNKEKALCELIMQKLFVDEEVKKKARELMEIYGIGF